MQLLLLFHPHTPQPLFLTSGLQGKARKCGWSRLLKTRWQIKGTQYFNRSNTSPFLGFQIAAQVGVAPSLLLCFCVLGRCRSHLYLLQFISLSGSLARSTCAANPAGQCLFALGPQLALEFLLPNVRPMYFFPIHSLPPFSPEESGFLSLILHQIRCQANKPSPEGAFLGLLASIRPPVQNVASGHPPHGAAAPGQAWVPAAHPEAAAF